MKPRKEHSAAAVESVWSSRNMWEEFRASSDETGRDMGQETEVLQDLCTSQLENLQARGVLIAGGSNQH